MSMKARTLRKNGRKLKVSGSLKTFCANGAEITRAIGNTNGKKRS